MENLQHILDRVKENAIKNESLENTKLTLSNQIDSTLPFSDDEMLKLEHEMLGCDLRHKEPSFTKKKEIKSTVNKQIEASDSISQNTLNILKNIQEDISDINNKIFINNQTQETKNSNYIESIPPFELVKIMINQVDDKDEAFYQIQTKDNVKIIPLKEYYDISKFINMLEQYQYSLIVDKNLSFENNIFLEYKNKLIIISQNLLANSFRFFEKSKIIDEIINDSKNIISSIPLTRKNLEPLIIIFQNIKNAMQTIEYKQQFVFAKFLNDRGVILNAITIINEMLAEYIIASARNLSELANQKIQNHIDNITLTLSSRKAYYNFHQSAKDFFRTNFSQDENLDKLPFFPKQDIGNEEIKNRMNKLFKSNKMNKSHFFIEYTKLIEKVRLIRNDLAHGNISKVHKDISQDIDEILIDFKYLAIDKDFLN